MPSLRSFRPSPSFVLASFAVVLAAGGDAVARDAATSATRLITGSQIAPRTVTARNVKPSSLTGAQLADGSVRNAGIARGPLTLDRFAQQALASLRGAKGDPGPQGQRGPQGEPGQPGSNATINGVPAGGELEGTYPNAHVKDARMRYIGEPNNPGFENGWVNFDVATWSPASIELDADGTVSLYGLVRGTQSTAAPSPSNVIFTLPAGYRPMRAQVFATASNNAFGRVTVLPNGKVVAEVGSTTWMSLNGVSFRAFQ